jgi:hypothetical protein
MKVLRLLLVFEFGATLGAWSLGMCAWPVAGALSTFLLITFMLSWPDVPGASDPSA